MPTGPGRRQMRYDADIVDRFRSTGDGWQTRMNEALRTFLQEHPLDAQ
nr:BrnA antitoxin family protein [Paraburkholderia humisilvae]